MSIAQPLRISYIELRSTKDIEFIELITPGYRLNIQQQSKNIFRQHFLQPLTVQGEAFSFSVHRKKWYPSLTPAVKDIQINVYDVLSNSQAQKFQTIRSKLDITIGLSPRSTSVIPPAQADSTPPSVDELLLATEELVGKCRRLRILVVGQSGVGKSTLIKQTFGIEQSSAGYSEPTADIERELISPQNDQFVLHVSKAFEPVDVIGCGNVKSFIENRKKRVDVKDQLHVVWLCFQIPIPGDADRLLEERAEKILKQVTSALHNIPKIAVFTKYDRLLTYLALQGKVNPEAAANEYLQKECVRPIQDLVQDAKLSYAAVSSNHGQEQARKDLIELTYQRVTETFGSTSGFQLDILRPVFSEPAVQCANHALALPPPHLLSSGSLPLQTLVFPPLQHSASSHLQPSGYQPLPYMPHSAVEGTITVAKQRYWRTLFASASFEGHVNVTEHFAVIHTDIVSVWNFDDPSHYLSSNEFREMVANLVGTTDAPTPASPHPPCIATINTTGGSGVSPVIPMTIVQPFKAGPAFVRRTYQQVLDVHHNFIAYVVHLVHVLQILSTLMARIYPQVLTRGAIGLAFNLYYKSEMWHDTHLQIKGFDYKLPGRVAVLKKIGSLVSASPSNDFDIFRALGSIPPEDLERDEEWYTAGDSLELRKRLASLANLVRDLQLSKESGTNVLTDIIALQRHIFDITPSWRRERFACLVNLANSLDERFRAEGRMEDLTEIITLRRDALQLTPANHSERVASLRNLANSLHERFTKEGGMGDLLECITFRCNALNLIPSWHEERAKSHAELANSLHESFRKEGRMVDLKRAIFFQRAAFQLTPPEHPEHSIFLVRLLDYLDERFKKEGDTEDLTEIIALRRAVLEFTPPGHEGRFVSLVNLVDTLHQRFRRSDTLADLDQIITFRRAALECAPTTPSDRCTSLSNLATCLREKYQRLGVDADLAEAIQHACAALVGCPSEHYSSCRDYVTSCVELRARRRHVPALTVLAIDLVVGSRGINQMVRSIAIEIIKTLPLRLLNTHTGTLCDRDAQMSCFEDSVSYHELLSSAQTGPECEVLIHKTISKFFGYTTLSHRWGTGEPSLRNIQGQNVYTLNHGEGLAKLQNFCILTLQHDYIWAWSDTCCIDKDSSSEFHEAVGSMFSWYRRSALTIVHLSDVPDAMPFSNSVWFRRGWTLQELLASPSILFYSQDWSLYMNCTSPNHKTDSAILAELQEVTGIGELHLKYFSPGMDDARSRLQWASTRSTTRSEDSAYSLFGIFQVHLPVFYGETVENALGRLLMEIVSQSGDTSVLDWVGRASSFHSCLPTDLVPYRVMPCRQPTPCGPTKCTDIDLEEARKLYRTLAHLPSPRFLPGRRLVLPCIVHRIIEVKLLEASSNTSHYDYDIVACGLVPLKLTLSSHLQEGSDPNLPYALVRPWNPKFLNLLPTGDVLGSLLAWLGQPFNALLIKSSLHNEYRRIAPDCLINVRVEDVGSVAVSHCHILEIV